MACGILFPDQELKQGPLHQELGILATGPPVKSPRHGLNFGKYVCNPTKGSISLPSLRKKIECQLTSQNCEDLSYKKEVLVNNLKTVTLIEKWRLSALLAETSIY